MVLELPKRCAFLFRACDAETFRVRLSLRTVLHAPRPGEMGLPFP